MKYTDYKLKDFIRDEYFKSWVVNPDEDSDFFWESFIKNNPDRATELLRARRIVQSIAFHKINEMDLSERERGEMWNLILADKPHPGKNIAFLPRKRSVFWFSIQPYVRVAAILLVAYMISVIWLELTPQKPIVGVEPLKILVKRTDKGEKLSTKLPDGSLVILNADSRIEFPERFSDSTRRITLEGQAFFDIQKDRLHPFVIEAGDFKTVVLGTSFVIRENKQKQSFDVAVVSGRVAVSEKSKKNHEKTVYVNPKQMASFNPENDSFTTTSYDYAELISWKDGVLYFKNANFNEVLRKLESWYGVTFIVNAAIDRRKDFTGQFKNENLKAVLEGLSFSFHFNFDIKDNRVTINEKS